MERKPLGPLEQIVLLFSVPITVLVLAFWLRELDLHFLATWRLLVLPLVILAGVGIGIPFGRWFGLRVAANVLRQRWDKFVPLKWAAWITLAVSLFAWGDTSRSAVLSYWQAAGQSSVPVAQLTHLLAALLCRSALWWYWITYLLVVLLTPLPRQSETASLQPNEGQA